MATSEVLLLQPIAGLGTEGEKVEVKAGYARNFLFPQKRAVPVTQANRKQMETLLKRREIRETRELTEARELEVKILKTPIAIAVKTGKGGKMFGAVTAKDLIERLAETGVELEKKQFHLNAPVKELGRHSISIKLHPDVTVELEFDVVSENPIDESEPET